MSFHGQDAHNHCGNFIFVHQGYFDNVHLNHAGLPHVPLLYVHLEIFCGKQVRGVILRLFYSRHFVVSGLLHAQKLGGGWWWPIGL